MMSYKKEKVGPIRQKGGQRLGRSQAKCNLIGVKTHKNKTTPFESRR